MSNLKTLESEGVRYTYDTEQPFTHLVARNQIVKDNLFVKNGEVLSPAFGQCYTFCVSVENGCEFPEYNYEELHDCYLVVKTEQLESEQSSISKTITNTSITMISSNLKQLLTTAFNLGITSITIDASQLEDAVKWSLPEDDVDYITFHRGNSKPDIAIALMQCSTATTEQPIWKDWYMTKNYHA